MNQRRRLSIGSFTCVGANSRDINRARGDAIDPDFEARSALRSGQAQERKHVRVHILTVTIGVLPSSVIANPCITTDFDTTYLAYVRPVGSSLRRSTCTCVWDIRPMSRVNKISNTATTHILAVKAYSLRLQEN